MIAPSPEVVLASAVIRAVIFDVGETLVSEQRAWASWAAWLGISELTLFAALGAVIERNRPYREALEMVRPDLELEREWQALKTAGLELSFEAEDVYPDVAPCMEALASRGYRLGIAGNQPSRAEPVLRALGLPLDFIGTSQSWRVAKPAPEFFQRIAEETGLPPAMIAYVGDRLDNDVLPALEAGMVAAFIRRGPWGSIHGLRPEVQRAQIRLDTLAELPPALEKLAGAYC